MSTAEEWRPVPGFRGYRISSLGRVVSDLRWNGEDGPREIRGWVSPKGYRRVSMQRGGRSLTRYVHQLVALAFRGAPGEGMQVRHVDGNSLNNCLDNLVYGTGSENIRDAILHGTHNNASKTECRRGHQYDEENTGWRGRGGRFCKTCNRAAARAERARLRESSAA